MVSVVVVNLVVITSIVYLVSTININILLTLSSLCVHSTSATSTHWCRVVGRHCCSCRVRHSSL